MSKGLTGFWLCESLQHAKKVVSDSPGLVNSVFNLPDGHMMF